MNFPEKREGYDPVRRDLVFRQIPMTILGLWWLLNFGCESPIRVRETGKRLKERENIPEEGDVIFVDERPYLLRNGKRYEIPDFNKFKKYTKFEEYGRRIFRNPGQNYESYPLGEIASLPTIIDPFTGGIKINKRFGGEMNIFVGGFLTDEGKVYDLTDPKEDMFSHIRRELELVGWQDWDNFYFTYGKRETGMYKAKDTTRSPQENIKHISEFMGTIKGLFPLVQFNLVAHSLGGVLAMAAAFEHFEAINNMILISSPVKGFSGKDDCQRLAWFLKQGLRVFLEGEEEKVTDYLFELWKDQIYQGKVEEFAAFFRRIGRRLVTIVADDDRIAPLESTIVENAELIRLAGSPKEECPLSLFPPRIDYLGIKIVLAAHGSPLKNKITRERIAKTFGENLARREDHQF